MHPWKVSQWHYCVGFGRWLHTSTSGTWYPRLPTLFGEQCLFLYQDYAFIIDIMYIFLYLLVQILWRNRPEIQVFQVSATSFSWCKDREESGVYPGWQCLGNVTPSLSFLENFFTTTRSTEDSSVRRDHICPMNTFHIFENKASDRDIITWTEYTFFLHQSHQWGAAKMTIIKGKIGSLILTLPTFYLDRYY